MTTKQLLIAVTTAVAITTMFGGSAASQTKTGSQITAAGAPFLTPLPSRFVIPSGDPRQPPFCRKLQGSAKCPPMLVYGGGAGGGLPTIDPAFTAYVPNVRVSMAIEEIHHEIVSNDGVDTSDADGYPSVLLEWYTTSSAASTQVSGPYPFGLPEPGAPFIAPFTVLIYDALVYGACDSFSSFAIDHTASITDLATDIEIGVFHGVDNSTIDALGFYNFKYTIRAEDLDGGVSDFHFSGKVNVTCSDAYLPK